MTVSAPGPLVYSDAGNGVTTEFSYPVRFLSDAELVVVLESSAGVQTVQTLTTHYTVSGASNPAGGSVTMLTPPAAGEKLHRYRNTIKKQVVDLSDSARNPAQSVEDQLDRLAMADQDLAAELERAVRVPVGSALDVAGLVASIELIGDSTDEIAVVAGIAGDVATVAANVANVATVAGIAGDVATVAANVANVATVAGAVANVATVAGNIAAIIAAPAHAEAAGTAADEAEAARDEAAGYADLAMNNWVVQHFDGNGAEATYTLSANPGSSNNCFVSIEGVQQYTTDYVLSGTSLALTAPVGIANIEVRFGTSIEVGTPADGSVGAATMKVSEAAAIRAALGIQTVSVGNKIINPRFEINQRGVSGTVTRAAGAYGHDRFKAGAGGCTYTFATTNGVTTITITAGTLLQVVEASAFDAGTYYLSWVGTAQGRINAGAYGASGSVAAAIDGSANVTVEWGVGTLSKPQLERGAVTPFSSRHIQQEQALCQRYYQVISLNESGANSFKYAGGAQVTMFNSAVALPVLMRAVPTASLGGTAIVYTNCSNIGMQASASAVMTRVDVTAAGVYRASQAAAWIILDAEL